jgi:hypothetical protein
MLPDRQELPTVNENPERCSTCRFWDHDCTDSPTDDETDLISDCRRYPPRHHRKEDTEQDSEQLIYGHPRTLAGNWCGEWQTKRPAGPGGAGSVMDQAYLAAAVSKSTEELQKIVGYKSTAMGMRAAAAQELARRYSIQRAADVAAVTRQHGKPAE